MWASLLAALKLFGAIAKAWGDRQLLRAGRAEQVVDARAEQDAKIRAARMAMAAVPDDPDSLRDDPDNRDRHKLRVVQPD